MIRRVVSANAMFVVGSTAAAAFGIGHMKSRRRERTQGEADSERGDVVHPLSNAFLREWRNWRTAGAVVFAKEADDMVVSGGLIWETCSVSTVSCSLANLFDCVDFALRVICLMNSDSLLHNLGLLVPTIR